MALGATLFAHDDNDAVLGIQSTSISKEKAGKLGLEYPYGSRVSRVFPGSAAEAIGLQPLDYIYRIDGYTVSKDMHLDDILEKYKPGDQAEVYYIRQGQPASARAALSRRGDISHPDIPGEEDPFLGIDHQGSHQGQAVEGVRVGIVHNSTAQAMGMQDGDIITEIDGYPIFDWHDVSVYVDNRKVGDPIAVTYYRDGQYYSESRPIKSEEATRSGHSRPNGPQVIQPEPEDEGTVSEVSLVEVPEEEVQELEEVTEAEIPLISGLQVEMLNIFPNPNSGIFDIQFELPERGQTSVRIFNPAGQPVYFNTLGNFSGAFSDRIDIANGVKGIYFLEVRQDEKSIIRKVILQ